MIESTRGGPESVEFVENPTAVLLIAVLGLGVVVPAAVAAVVFTVRLPPLDAPMFRSDRLSGDPHTAARASARGWLRVHTGPPRGSLGPFARDRRSTEVG